MEIKTAVLTLVALIAFASNSILTRLALGSHQIDAATFSSIRLCAGAAALALLVRVRSGGWAALRAPSAGGALALFAYALPFSFAYLRIGAAVGALVLFGVVQVTMIGYGMTRGERPGLPAWTGFGLAIAGLAALTMPSASRPDLYGLLLMTIAGMAWAVYSLLGRGIHDPVAANARSFLWSVPLALAVNVALRASVNITFKGILLAIVSGALTSGLGYALWYQALPGLKITQAAIVQLCVPVIAAFAAVVFLDEGFSTRLALASMLILGGVGLALFARFNR